MVEKLKGWVRIGWPPLLVVVLFLLFWEWAVNWYQVDKYILPSPLAVAKEGIAIFPRVWMHTLATMKICLTGFIFGVGFGLLVAMLLHVVPGFKAGFYPLIIVSQNIPTLVLTPLLMIWFGFGILPKVIVITLVCFFPIAVATLVGFTETDRNMMDYMKMIGAKKMQIFRKLEFPNAIPYFFAGLKISATYSVMGAVITDWLGAKEGLGIFLKLTFNSFRADQVFVAIFVIIVLSFVLFGLIVLLEKWIVRWNPGKNT